MNSIDQDYNTAFNDSPFFMKSDVKSSMMKAYHAGRESKRDNPLKRAREAYKKRMGEGNLAKIPLKYERSEWIPGLFIPVAADDVKELQKIYHEAMASEPFIDWQIFYLMGGILGYFPFNFLKYINYKIRYFFWERS